MVIGRGFRARTRYLRCLIQRRRQQVREAEWLPPPRPAPRPALVLARTGGKQRGNDRNAGERRRRRSLTSVVEIRWLVRIRLRSQSLWGGGGFVS